jgi:hypothetical protein
LAACTRLCSSSKNKNCKNIISIQYN